MIEGNEALLPTAGSDPGARAPAPGSLRLVQALVNTSNAETGQDLLGTAAEAATWLAAARLLPPRSERLPGRGGRLQQAARLRAHRSGAGRAAGVARGDQAGARR